MRALVPIVLPWLVMFALLSASYALEARWMRQRREPDATTGLMMQGPSVGLSVLATLLLGPLVAPIYFWMSRKKLVGLLLGLGVTGTAVGAYLGSALLARAWARSDTLARARDACMIRGPVASDPDTAKSEGPCVALVEAYESGQGCADGAELVSCSSPIASPFSVRKDPEQARAVLEHRCTERSELGACIALGERAEGEAERANSHQKVRKVCCKWWETGVCERFLTLAECRSK